MTFRSTFPGVSSFQELRSSLTPLPHLKINKKEEDYDRSLGCFLCYDLGKKRVKTWICKTC